MGTGFETSPWLHAPGQTTVATLVADQLYTGPETTIAEVRDQFEQNPRLQSLPVVANGRPVGIIHGRSLLRYSNDQHSPAVRAADLMQAGVDERLVIACKTTIDALLQKVAHQELDFCNGYLIVCDDAGRYTGRLILADVLKALAVLQQQNTRYANPLTGLPGHVPINEKITELMQKNRLFVAAYCDVDGLKSYNDIYGYACGDDVIRYAGGLLQSHLDSEQDFIGHIGGDDFIAIFQSPDWFERCDAIVHQCEEEAPRFYSHAHREAGGMHDPDRLGRRIFHPLFSLSIGAVSVEPGKFRTHHEVLAAATEVKKRAMSTHGGAIYIDERSYRSETTQLPVVRN